MDPKKHKHIQTLSGRTVVILPNAEDTKKDTAESDEREKAGALER